MDDELPPDPRPNSWSAKDDALVFYILAICPFLDIEQNANLLPHKTPTDIIDRFEELMNTPSLQKRLLKEFPPNSFVYDSLPFTESEKYSLHKIIESNPVDITKTIATVPYLFNPIRTPKEIAKELLRIKKESKLGDYPKNYYVNEYLEYVEKACNLDIPGNYKGKKSFRPHFHKKLKHESLKQVSSSNTVEITFEELEAFVNSQFERSDLAALVGFMSLHKIQKTRVVIGRESPFIKVDIDLSKYCMQSVSRNHCFISFCSDGKFYLTVLAREVLINAEMFYKGQNIQLKNHDIIDIGGVPLMIIENPLFRKQVDELLEKKDKSFY